MCGRFTQAQIAELDREVFKLLEVPHLEPRYNVAPTQDVAVVRELEGARSLSLIRWGLIPHWAKDPTIGNRMINARAETVPEKPAFRDAFRLRRCLVPADGFYEWARTPRGKQPHYLRMTDGRPFAMAGLWDRWHAPDGPIESCTIITTGPNDLVRPLHDRMPVILAPEDYEQWLDPEGNTAELAALLRPYPAGAMRAYPVSRFVNDPKHEGPACIAPRA